MRKSIRCLRKPVEGEEAENDFLGKPFMYVNGLLTRVQFLTTKSLLECSQLSVNFFHISI